MFIQKKVSSLISEVSLFQGHNVHKQDGWDSEICPVCCR